MKPIYQKLVEAPDQGFAAWVIRGRNMNSLWHFHSECELILILKGTGSRLVGDHLGPLRPDDLVLLGPELPHSYHNNLDLPGRSPVHALILQFSDASFSENWRRWPALAPVLRLVKHARRGLRFTGATRDRVAGLMRELVEAGGLRRIILFLEILDALAASRQAHPLASARFVQRSRRFNQERMTQIWRFIHEHLHQPIFVRDLAALVHMSRSAFSRFFRLHTAKTLPNFVNELRAEQACRLLTESDMNVTEIASACGFSNLSNFNRQFLRLKQTTPRRYRRDTTRVPRQSQ